jgi:hypothetical protein
MLLKVADSQSTRARRESGRGGVALMLGLQELQEEGKN